MYIVMNEYDGSNSISTSKRADGVEIADGIAEFLLCLGMADQELNWLCRSGVVIGGRWNSIELFLSEFQLGIPFNAKQFRHVVGEVVDCGLNGSHLVELETENTVGGLGHGSLPGNSSMLSCSK